MRPETSRLCLQAIRSLTIVYDAFGQLAEEYSPATTWSRDYIPFNGQTAAIENAAASPCLTCYLSYDQLGTVRMVTDASASVITRHDYLPFGDEIPGGVAGRNSQFGPYVDNVDEKFTGPIRDAETMNDFFHARYYTAPLMRMLSSDPGNAGADLTDPQTWNGYAYVRNNPLAFVDPSGMDLIAPDPGDGPCFVFDPWCDGPGPVPPPVPCFDCGGGGGGGGRNPGPPSTSTSNGGLTPVDPPFPPGSFPGGENLGLPPGLSVPGPFGLDPSNPWAMPLCPTPCPATPSIWTEVGELLSSPWVLVAAYLLEPPTNMRSEATFMAANNDFYSRRRAIRAFYAEHLNSAEIESCEEQWHEAIRACTEELAKPVWQQNKYKTGGHSDVFDCARGLVDRKCGGTF